ncbi:PQQ-binding-like beta-propeller repeat protein [Nocardia sp. NPDC057668]|uniref:outer membrane protein assembly factor BamB family protein n=1 Tax=Nocardia sp. NPDC057668 TaxID=3346202 RepID=UPI00366CC1EA
MVERTRRSVVASRRWTTILLSAVCVAVTGAFVSGDRGEAGPDHTLAGSAVAAPVPRRLDAQAYRLSLPNPAGVDSGVEIRSAGAGFVVVDATGLRAFDGVTGRERWHYSVPRTTDHHGTTRLMEVASTEGGRVVVVGWSGLGLRSFDAFTGELLWADSEFLRAVIGQETIPRDVSNASAGNEMLVLADAEHLTRYDARTGRRMWTVEPGAEPCTFRGGVATTPEAIYYSIGCRESSGAVTVTFRAFDPATGAVLSNREIVVPTNQFDIDLTAAADTVELWCRYRVPAGAGVPVLPDDPARLLVADPAQLATVAFAPWPAEPDPRSDRRYVKVLPLATQRVELEYGWLRVWNLPDDSGPAVVPVDMPGDCGRPLRLTAVPGAVLVSCRTEETTEIYGFGGSA